MAVTRDNKFLITGSKDKNVKKIPIPSQEVVKDFGRISHESIKSIHLAPDGESLFVHDKRSDLKVINLSDGTQGIRFPMTRICVPAQPMLITGDGGHLFRVSMGTHLRLWNVRDKTNVFNSGCLAEIINCICD
jgi:WD40 repeat protein